MKNYGNTPNIEKVYNKLSGGAALYLKLSKIFTTSWNMNYLI